MPYDFTACLAHVDLTFDGLTDTILRITGILNHNIQCQEQVMKRLPAVPLHPHVWEIALQQLSDTGDIKGFSPGENLGKT
ncbi:MAG TPA: hypothetical protein VGO47_01425 [Chlamydiales bacterium]|nr:hypothetical protein [Chlamydiales bacterium]